MYVSPAGGGVIKVTGSVTEDGVESSCRSQSDFRSGGKRCSRCSAARQRGTRGSGDSGLLCDVIIVVLFHND